jgi:excisionase family DNA binding protein
MDRSPLLEDTARFWQPRASRTLTQEDARQMVENVVGYFATLQRWSAAAGVEEAAEISRMTRPTIWRKIRCGELRAWGARRCYRVSVSEVLAPVETLLFCGYDPYFEGDDPPGL